MARPLLDTSALRKPIGPTTSGWARGLTQAASGIAKGLDKRFDIKRKEENKFINDMSFDINSVSNDLFKGYAVDQYSKFRNTWVDQFKEQKGKLTPEQKIMLQSDMNSLQSSVEYLNALSEFNDKAMLLPQKDPRVQYKGQEWASIMDMMNEKDLNPDKVKEAGSQFMSSDAGVPGTDLVAMDINDLFISTAPSVKKLLPKEDIDVGVETFQKDGENWEAGYKTIGHGNVTALDDLVYNQWGDNKFNVLKNADKGAKQMLSPEEQKQAMLQYGDGVGSLAKYALKNKVDQNAKNEFVKPTREYEAINRVPDGSDSDTPGGSGWTTVKQTEIGWPFGTTPIPITKSIEGTTYKNASIVAVNKGPLGEYTATLVVPKGKNEFMDIIKKADAEDRDLTGEELAQIQSEIMNPDKYTTVETPLENVNEELEAGFKKHKLYLPGFEDIQLQEEKVDERDPIGLGI